MQDDLTLVQEPTREIALEIASMIREAESGAPIDAVRGWEAFCRMMASDARTPGDALALLVVARRFLNGISPVEESAEYYALTAGLAALVKAAQTLEKVSGERASTFAGHEWH